MCRSSRSRVPTSSRCSSASAPRVCATCSSRPSRTPPASSSSTRSTRSAASAAPVWAADLAGRRAILKVHSKGKPFAPDVDFEQMAKRTVGMSGADLANVINEAALLTARYNGTLITAAALEESVDRVVGGPRRKSKIISDKEKKITAYHEGGHALAAWAMPDLEPVYKLTILPRGRTGGHALVVPEDDKGLMTRSEMIARLVFAMGGRSAEELVFHEPTTGASSDIDQATKIARAMVTEYGMSARLGAVRYGREQGDPFLGRSMGNQPDYSLEVAHEIDEEVRALIEAAHTEAWEILNAYRDVLDDLVFELMQKETLTRRDLERIFGRVEKRPRITAFNDFGSRTPSDKPPIKTPAERARERGEPWPPATEPVREPTPVGSYPGGAGNGVTPPGPNGSPSPTPPGAYPGGPGGPGFPAHAGHPAAHPGGAHRADEPVRAAPPAALPNSGAGPHRPNAVPHNYGAPPDWRPAPAPPGPARAPPPAGGPPRAEAAVRELLIAVGEDPNREGLRETPARVARAYAEIFAGLYVDPDSVLDKTFDEDHRELVLVRDIPVSSFCEHHLLPFSGVGHVGYIPSCDGRVTGLSKIARLVDLYARRPQVQERITAQVADALVSRMEPQGVIVVIDAEHLCMSMRGIRKPGSRTTTSAVRGLFQTSASSRAEAMALIRQ